MYCSCFLDTTVPYSRGWILGVRQLHRVWTLCWKSVHRLLGQKKRGEGDMQEISEWGQIPCELSCHLPNLPHCWSRQIDLIQKPSDALAHVQTDGWRAEASALISGRAVGTWREYRLESGAVFRALHAFPVQSSYLLQIPHACLVSSSLLTYWHSSANLLEKKGRKHMYRLVFMLFRKVKRRGKQTTEESKGVGRRKNQDPKIGTVFKLCPISFFFLLCNLTPFFFFFGNLLRIQENGQLFGCKLHSN